MIGLKYAIKLIELVLGKHVLKFQQFPTLNEERLIDDSLLMFC